jgi:formylglycine-generating enzyme required for sulfatase activity
MGRRKVESVLAKLHMDSDFHQIADEAIRLVESRLPFRFIGMGSSSCQLPRFQHMNSPAVGVLIPGGRFSMGLSSSEEAAARAIRDPPPMDLEHMRPVHEVNVGPILVSERPVLERDFPPKSSVAGSRQVYPVSVSLDDARSFSSKHGARLIREEEWEYCCRGGTSTLFFFGNTVPDTKHLTLLVDFDLAKAVQPNPFGLFGMFSGEWCATEFRHDYRNATRGQKGVYVVRGGASQLWPWQHHEWVWCVSANRMPSADLFDGTCCFRMVWDV